MFLLPKETMLFHVLTSDEKVKVLYLFTFSL